MEAGAQLVPFEGAVNAPGNPLAVHWVCPSMAEAVDSAMADGATELELHADGDVRCNVGGWDGDTFTDTLRKAVPASPEEAARAAARALDGGQLHSLQVSKLGLTADTVGPIAEALQRDGRLVRLNLSHNKLGHDGLGSVARGLSGNRCQQIRELQLNHTLLADPGAASLARLLRCSPILAELYLGKCQIGDQGLAALSAAVERHSGLSALGLAGNRITDDGLYALADALQVNRVLRKVELQNNKVGSLGVSALAASLGDNTCLQTVHLQGNLEDQARWRQVVDFHPELKKDFAKARCWRAPPM